MALFLINILATAFGVKVAAVTAAAASTGASDDADPELVDATRRLGEQTAFYGKALASTADAVRRYPGEVLRLIAVMGMGTGALAVIGGTVVIIGFLTLSTGALIAVQGYNTLSNVGIEALTGFLGGVPQRPVHRAGDRRGGAGRHHRRRRHRAARRHAHQRGDRRAGSDGYPGDHLSGVDPHRRRRPGGHPALHRRGADVVSGDPVRHDGHLRPVPRRVRPLLLDVPAARPTCCGRSSPRCRWRPR